LYENVSVRFLLQGKDGLLCESKSISLSELGRGRWGEEEVEKGEEEKEEEGEEVEGEDEEGEEAEREGEEEKRKLKKME
jgi:hypothetical protein